MYCSIRSPKEERLYYNHSAKGHAPLASKQPPSTCLMRPGISGSRKMQGRTPCRGWSRKAGLRSCTPWKRKVPEPLPEFFFSTVHTCLVLSESCWQGQVRDRLPRWEERQAHSGSHGFSGMPPLCCGSRQGAQVPSTCPPLDLWAS